MIQNKVVLVIGNGFDLNLNLATGYKDFVNSEEWKQMFHKYASESHHYSLLKYLNAKANHENWFDLEQALLDYANIKMKDVWSHDVEIDKREYATLCQTLKEYLDMHLRSRSGDIQSNYSTKILRKFQYNRDLRKIYTFNYTSLEQISCVANILHLVPCTHIHGSVDDTSIILGFETSRFETIMPEYSFMIKSSSPDYHSVGLELDMIDADEVIIFGHSLNMIDAVYFEHYLQNLSNDVQASRRLTIITFDEASRQSILNNLRGMELSVPKLFSRGNLEFILVKDIEHNPLQKSKFEELLRRIDI